jgi:photosystem II stability/assembly factor-like uncharacterized protein
MRRLLLMLCRAVLLLLIVGFLSAPLNASGQEKKRPAAKAKTTPAVLVPVPPQSPPPPDYAGALGNLTFREIGPAIMGGRIDDFAVVESDPNLVYVGTASGGIWKTTNAGITWTPIFDKEAVSTIGDLALAPSDPSILYVGTGESNNRQSSSWGNGVYKTTDAGKTWEHIGLKDTHHIGRVVIHPTNPSVVYVAAAGRLWGPSKERGVYKTTDGGKTWNLVLFLNEDTGINEIAIDPQSPDTLYAGAYQRRRTVFGFNGSGLHGAIYKSTDGGATWKKLVKGLPYESGGEVGRIGLAVYARDPNIVYALVEHAKGGTFRSEDKGETWRKMSDTNPRPSYYSQILIDPNNDLRIWVLGAPLYFSEDGGKTFIQNRGSRIHSDHHALWINPRDSDHMIIGTDGGIHWTYDAGRTWDFVNTIALGQFYEIGVDMRKPYWICGGLQDNNTWCGPSATTNTRGIVNDDWLMVGGGDGFYAQVDPTDPNIVYAESQDGNVLRRNLVTGESKSIRPMEKEGEPRYRFQWNSPIVISPHDPKTIYYGGNFLFKSTDRGDNWTKASPDLTSAVDRKTLQIMGKVPDRDTLSRNDGVQQYPCITSISESALSPKVIWVGTDDGNLQMTRDGGANWKNTVEKIAGLPRGTYVSRVIASHHAEGTAYATFDGHRMNDFRVYVYLTADYGETWKNIGAGLPDNNGIANVIREHHRNPDLLFVGTEYGAYASLDRGTSWTPLKMNLPTVPVDDIAIHPRDNDLILGTHGRSIWVMDDITPLEQMNGKVLTSDLYLFDVRAPISWRLFNRTWFGGHKSFEAPNPPSGAMINYFLKNKLEAKERVRITISDKSGRTVREIMCGGPPPTQPQEGGRGAASAGMSGGGTGAMRCDPKPGINRFVWDLRQSAPMQLSEEQQQGIGFFGGIRGSRVDPGEYMVKIDVVEAPAPGSGPRGGPGGGSSTPGKWELTRSFTVQEDPRVTLSEADRKARRDAINRLTQMSTGMMMAQRGIMGLRTNLNNALEGWKRPGGQRVSDDVRKAAEELLKKVDELYPKFGTLPSDQGQAGSAGPPLVERGTPLPMRVGRLMSGLEGWSGPPTASQLEEIETLGKQVKEASDQARKLTVDELNALNKMMRDAGVPYITTAGGGGRPGGPPGEN